jgi:hypothetical protein
MQDVSVNLKVPVKTFHCLKSTGSHFTRTFFRGVPLVEDGVAIYMSIFDQPVNSEMGCSFIDICSISVPFLPNCIVKPFINFTPTKNKVDQWPKY